MEFAIHQPLKIYTGELGFLAGSPLRGAWALKQNLIGVGILWKYGYYNQIRKADQTMDSLFIEKYYAIVPGGQLYHRNVERWDGSEGCTTWSNTRRALMRWASLRLNQTVPCDNALKSMGVRIVFMSDVVRFPKMTSLPHVTLDIPQPTG